MKVRLVRGSMQAIEHDHGNDRAGAWRRATALATLHGVRIREEGDDLIVDASAYYSDASPARKRRRS